MDSDIELWNSRRKKVVAEEDLDPADFEKLLLEFRDAHQKPKTTNSTTPEASSADFSTQDKKIPHPSEQTKKMMLGEEPVEAPVVEFFESVTADVLSTTFVVGILWDGSDSAAVAQLFHALPRSHRIVYLVQQGVSSRYLALEVDEIRRYTKIPVIEAVDGLAVLPGRIYLGPFMQQLTLQNGFAKLQPLATSVTLAAQNLKFFASIAGHETTSPVAILLQSGDENQSMPADENSFSLISSLSKQQDKDLIYAETVNAVLASGGHVFFNDHKILQSETIVASENGHAVAQKAPPVEISVGLQKLLQGERLSDECAIALAVVSDEVDVDVQHTPAPEIMVMETATADLSGGEGQTDLQGEIAALKRETQTLQTINDRLQQENAELIEICQLMDINADASLLKTVYQPKQVAASAIALLLLDKQLRLRSFNQAATESILDIDVMDIERNLSQLLLSSKQVDVKHVRNLESAIHRSLNMGRSQYGEALSVDLEIKGEAYCFKILPFQSHAGQPVGVAISWENP